MGIELRWLMSLTLLASWPLWSKEGHGHVGVGWDYPFILSLHIRTSYLCMYVKYIIATYNAFLVRHTVNVKIFAGNKFCGRGTYMYR